MIESDILKTKGTEHHPQQPHGHTVPPVHSGDADINISDTAHRDKEHSHHEKKIEPQERKASMKNRPAQTLSTLLLSAICLLGLNTDNSINAATIQAIEDNSAIAVNIVQDGDLDEIERIDVNNINIDNIDNIEENDINITNITNITRLAADNITLNDDAIQISLNADANQINRIINNDVIADIVIADTIQ